MKTQSALPWFGSDSEIAEVLAAKLDGCRHVTIPFCGGMSILPFLKAKAIVANDLHADAINFYRVASGVYGEGYQRQLISRCKATLSHPDEMKTALELIDDQSSKMNVCRAWAFWAICWLGRKGKGGTKNQGGKPSIRRNANGGSNSSRLVAAAGDLEEWVGHFVRCEWESDCFRNIIPKVVDEIDCGIYLDGPWDGLGAGYRHNFEENDHREMRDLLERFQRAKILIRYGDTPLIRELYQGWKIEESESRNQANNVKSELWITKN